MPEVPHSRDPVVDAYRAHVDVSLIRRNLKITIDFPGLLRALAEARVEFIIVDGAAATAHGSARLPPGPRGPGRARSHPRSTGIADAGSSSRSRDGGWA